MTAALNVRVELGDRAGADVVAAALEPFPHRWSGAGTTPLSMGPTDLALARYAAFIGDHDTATARFADATASTTDVGAVAWLARGLVHEGIFLLDIGRRADGDDALRRAGELADRHALPYVSRRLRHLAS